MVFKKKAFDEINNSMDEFLKETISPESKIDLTQSQINDMEEIHEAIISSMNKLNASEGENNTGNFNNLDEIIANYIKLSFSGCIINQMIDVYFSEGNREDKYIVQLNSEANMSLNKEDKISFLQNDPKNKFSEISLSDSNSDISIKTVPNTVNIPSDDLKTTKKKRKRSPHSIQKIIDDKIIKDPDSNKNRLSKVILPSRDSPQGKNFRKNNKFLKDFNPKFMKKENIDKKIFRKFRNYFKIKYKQNPNDKIFSPNRVFFKVFFRKNLLPPMKLGSQNVSFKSFNNAYILWIFSQEGMSSLYYEFIEQYASSMYSYLTSNSKIKAEENMEEKLKEYIEKLPEIYGSTEKKIMDEEDEDYFQMKNCLGSNDREESNNILSTNFESVNNKVFQEEPFYSEENKMCLDEDDEYDIIRYEKLKEENKNNEEFKKFYYGIKGFNRFEQDEYESSY